ncbi:MAG TPA: hypothetical protein VFU05_14720 [Cyclobacteriaceae bacterium]|nr:hypothetical protein [Cyclobacteriaceae bacterium]
MKILIFNRRTIIIFIILLIVLSIGTIKIESPSDGNDLIGFPFRFYEYLGGKRTPEPLTRYIINYTNLIIDTVIIGIASILIEILARKKRKNVT